MPLFKKAETDTCGFCEANGFPICAHAGGCWNQPNHVPDNYNPSRDEQAMVNAIATGVKADVMLHGLPRPEELS